MPYSLKSIVKDMTAPLTSEDMHYAIDGGSLLYRLPWARGSTFATVCKMYVDYVKKFKQPTIVFLTHMSHNQGYHVPVVL